jgi:tRNA (uracil-5-)-methyltransferase
LAPSYQKSSRELSLSINCTHFNQCNSCHYDGDYQNTINDKVENLKKHFNKLLDDIPIDIFASTHKHFRDRMEFRIFHKDSDIFYAMYGEDKKIFFIDECFVVNRSIFDIMPKLLSYIKNSSTLKTKLYSVEFFSSKSKDMLITLIYHKKLEDDWQIEAKELESILDTKIIGRSRKQKLILSSDFITENLLIKDKEYIYQNQENSFTQPNSLVNEQMISWCVNNIADKNSDILELYCGNGNFTIAFSDYCNKILATEVSKNAIKSAKQNMILNNKQNIKFARMSSDEIALAINKTREFTRLKEIDLDSYDFKTIFVDPPRAGLDEETLKFVGKFTNIIYISCNYHTLYENLQTTLTTHDIKSFAIFDQFAYSKHLECGIYLTKRKSDE